jgi:hypothetical protein
MINRCNSGGAQGSDTYFGAMAHRVGHTVKHYTFPGHECYGNPRDHQSLSSKELAEADPYLHEANKTLKRQFPTRYDYVNQLLQRNWWEIKDAEAVYAIADLDTRQPDTVLGGTGWAVQMFVDKMGHNAETLPLWIFSPSFRIWMQYKPGGFQSCSKPPRPEGIYAGIGTRQLTQFALRAIEKLYQ